VLPQRCRRRYLVLGGLGSWAWGPESISRNGAPTCSNSTGAASRQSVDGALSRPGDVCGLYWGLFVPGEGPGGLGEPARSGQGRLMFSTAASRVLSQLAFTLAFSLSCRLLLHRFSAKGALALMDQAFTVHDQNVLSEKTLAQGSTPCASRHPCKPQQESSFTLVEADDRCSGRWCACCQVALPAR